MRMLAWKFVATFPPIAVARHREVRWKCLSSMHTIQSLEALVNALDWQVVSTGPLIQGTATRGAMQTVLVNVQPQKGAATSFSLDASAREASSTTGMLARMGVSFCRECLLSYSLIGSVNACRYE